MAVTSGDDVVPALITPARPDLGSAVKAERASKTLSVQNSN